MVRPDAPYLPFEERYVARTPEDWGPSGSQTVMIDFTADWCPNCKVLEATVLNTTAVRNIVVQNRVVIMKADTTRKVPELMKVLGANAVPALAIFPADNPNAPIVFRNMYTVGDVLEALEKAGPSKP